jgi:hypothetical protein
MLFYIGLEHLKLTNEDLYNIELIQSKVNDESNTSNIVRFNKGFYCSKILYIPTPEQSKAMGNIKEQNMIPKAKVSRYSRHYSSKDNMDPQSYIYIINSFYGYMKEKYHNKINIEYCLLEFNGDVLNYKSFLSNVIGSRDPSIANPSSIRG